MNAGCAVSVAVEGELGPGTSHDVGSGAGGARHGQHSSL